MGAGADVAVGRTSVEAAVGVAVDGIWFGVDVGCGTVAVGTGAVAAMSTAG